jgi:hypothetical protein
MQEPPTKISPTPNISAQRTKTLSWWVSFVVEVKAIGAFLVGYGGGGGV